MAKVKICGLRRKEDIEAVNELKPDYIGFVFAKSKRQVMPDDAARLREGLAEGICPVGVFVNETEEKILDIVNRGIIDIVQLHGQETPEQVAGLRKALDGMEKTLCGRRGASVKIIKALRMEPDTDLSVWEQSAADYLLLDAGAGGTGTTFDHRLITEEVRNGKPWFLAGGMNVENAAGAIRAYGPFAVDTSSGVETDGYKDREKIKCFITQVRTALHTERKAENE